MQMAQIRKTGPSASTCRERCFQQQCLQSKLKHLQASQTKDLHQNYREFIHYHICAPKTCLENLQLSRRFSCELSIIHIVFDTEEENWKTKKIYAKKQYCTTPNWKKIKQCNSTAVSTFSHTFVIPLS